MREPLQNSARLLLASIRLVNGSIALCAPGPGQVTLLPVGVTWRYVFVFGSVSVKSDTSVTAKPRVSSAKYARLPSLETENEWMPEPLVGGAV